MKIKFDFNILLIALFFLCFAYACANRGQGPQGGKKDEIPPVLVKSNPEMGAVNFSKKDISIEFNEIVKLEKLTEYVVISPPQKKNPLIVARGKRVVVKFEEDLLDSTTYTINFGDAIVDNNEGNALKNFRFAFSTGNEIDTMGVSGYLINAEDLNPLAGIIVGIYTEQDDSVFTKEPFLRIGKTNEEGFFYIDNMRKGKYKLFALEDSNRDYYFQTGEGLAMYDSIISPSLSTIEKIDTLWSKKDSTKIDTIHRSVKTRFLPDSLILRFFKENTKRQYLVKSARTQKEKITLFFNAEQKELPTIEPLNFDWKDKHIVQVSNQLDTLSYWFTDSLLWQQDTLKMAVSYLKTDSIFQLVPTTDTLSLSMRKARVSARENKKEKEEIKIEPLQIRNNLSPKFDVYRDILISFDEPISVHDFSKVVLSQKKDTVLTTVDYNWNEPDSTKTKFIIQHKWEAGASYELKIDSAAFISILDKANNELKTPFGIRSMDEYSEIKIILTEFDSTAILQILDAKDMVIDSKPALKEGTLFKHLNPTDYYLRLFIDRNGNGKWDTGNFSKREQPEEVFYYPKKLSLKANFEFTENWDHYSTHVLQQKPQGLKKEPQKGKR